MGLAWAPASTSKINATRRQKRGRGTQRNEHQHKKCFCGQRYAGAYLPRKRAWCRLAKLKKQVTRQMLTTGSKLVQAWASRQTFYPAIGPGILRWLRSLLLGHCNVTILIVYLIFDNSSLILAILLTILSTELECELLE